MKTLKAFALLLSCPSHALQAKIPSIRPALGEGLAGQYSFLELEPLMILLETGDIDDLQQRYRQLFETSRDLSLYVSEHMEGNKSQQSAFITDLHELYDICDFDLSDKTRPDYLPVMLEFLSTRPFTDAKDLLEDASHILEVLASRLKQRNSEYAALFDILVDISAAG